MDFFNYRRNDAEFAADRIYDSIKREFGEGASFRDLYHLKLGTDFSDELRDSVRGSRVFDPPHSWCCDQCGIRKR